MVDKKDKQAAEPAPEMDKPTPPIESAETAPETGKTTEAEGSVEDIDEEDIQKIVEILNEIKSEMGGKGEISNIPPELFGVIKFVIDKMNDLGEAFADPLFVTVLNDMIEQKNENGTPSLLVAIARNIPIMDIEELADNENYADAQKAISDNLKKTEDEGKAEEELYAKFDKTKSEFEAYCQENSLSDEAKSALWEKVIMLMKVFGDGFISKNEFAQIDKMNNYDNDIAGLKKQLPEKPKKEVLPDKASIDAAMNPAPVQKSQPRNMMETMASMNGGVDVTDIGKRKRRPM